MTVAEESQPELTGKCSLAVGTTPRDHERERSIRRVMPVIRLQNGREE
jgi:hypothetical protein